MKPSGDLCKKQILVGRTYRYLKEGKTHEEIAELLKVPIAEVHSLANICKMADENRRKQAAELLI